MVSREERITELEKELEQLKSEQVVDQPDLDDQPHYSEMPNDPYWTGYKSSIDYS